jgi:hypothetical protein
MKIAMPSSGKPSSQTLGSPCSPADSSWPKKASRMPVGSTLNSVPTAYCHTLRRMQPAMTPCTPKGGTGTMLAANTPATA